VSEICIETLKNVHGTQELPSGEKAYWEIGIENSDIKQKAYQKQQSEPYEKRAPREAYIDFIDSIKILKQPNNWPHFESVFNIPLPGEKGKKYYLDWMDKINELRRITAHRSPYRNFRDEDFELIASIKGELYKRAVDKGFDL
jgi:DNA sulfur modification protein DndB